MRAIVKSVIKNVKKRKNSEQIRKHTPYNVSGVRHTTCVFLIRRVWTRVRRTPFSFKPKFIYDALRDLVPSVQL